jgi:hypothetical protein
MRCHHSLCLPNDEHDFSADQARAINYCSDASP